MHAPQILDGLNEKQTEAVSAPLQNLLILAGAGSGKTRVLIHRLAWLFTQAHISPQQILAVTFTNKAAKEMRHRMQDYFHIDTRSMWVGTFHGLAHKFLRLHAAQAHLQPDFQVIDSDDQYRLVRRIIKRLGLDEKHWPARPAQHFINSQKDQGKRAAQVEADTLEHKTLVKVYAAYETHCQDNQLVDFCELLLRCYETLENDAALRYEYQQRFRYILVDEFQDTNSIQYQWLRLLITEHNHIMAVGDDDQSIYGWRGAQIENIHRFEHDLAPVAVIRLEQNYRSSQTILKAANALIAHNQTRLGKDLWTDIEAGQPIYLYQAFNELEEAKFIVSQIQQKLLDGHACRDMAILYRSNAQSRLLEEALIHANVPYRIYGGLKFFERAEIKTALAYCRLIQHKHDNDALERVINTPTRGIGERTLEHLRQYAREHGRTLWHALIDTINQKTLAARACTALSRFAELIAGLEEALQNQALHTQIQTVIEHTELIAHYRQEPGEKGQARVENLAELVTAAKQFSADPGEELPVLSAFLAHAALEAGETQADETADSVQLMTLHAAKGLEFPVVFICGLEEQLFPSPQSIQRPIKLEEERRLCYVGMTRAMQCLYLTYAEYRRVFGDNQLHLPSRFIREIPAEFCQEIRLKNEVRRPHLCRQPQRTQATNTLSNTRTHSSGTNWSVGQAVRHEKFGTGVVLNYESGGRQARVQVRFANGENKWLIAAYARLHAE